MRKGLLMLLALILMFVIPLGLLSACGDVPPDSGGIETPGEIPDEDGGETPSETPEEEGGGFTGNLPGNPNKENIYIAN
ncbi:MAG: hypothetical protein IKB67_03540 [Clostridia bacterium]|nr:hypothetical protein [Clostridia bacterium]